MTDIDEQLTGALERRAENVAVRDDLDAILDGINVIRFADDARADRTTRRTQLVLVAAAGLIAVTGGLVWVQSVRDEPASSSQQPTTPANSASPPDASPIDTGTAIDQLLYPTAASNVEVHVGPDTGFDAAALFRSPTGSMYRVTVTASANWSEDSEAEQRVFNGHTFSLAADDSVIVYSALGECARVAISGSKPGATAWNADASALMSSVEIDGRAVAMSQPAGWESFGHGVPGVLVQLSFETEIDGTDAMVNLMQMPDSPVAALVYANHALQSTTLGQAPAFFTEQNGDSVPFNVLLWDNGGDAAALMSADASVDDLKAVALTLEAGHADEWNTLLSSDDLADPEPTGTAPEETGTPADLCGTASLTVSP